MVESICETDFIDQTPEEAWDFLESLSEKTRQWVDETESHISIVVAHPTASKGAIPITPTIGMEAKMATILRRLEALEVKETPKSVHQVSMSVPSKESSDPFKCVDPMVNNPMLYGMSEDQYLEQVNALHQFKKTQNNPYSNTYNPRWRNHPNFSWSQGSHQGGPSHSFVPTGPTNQYVPSQAPHGTNHFGPMSTHPAPPGFQLEQHLNHMEKSIKSIELMIGQLASALTNEKRGICLVNP